MLARFTQGEPLRTIMSSRGKRKSKAPVSCAIDRRAPSNPAKKAKEDKKDEEEEEDEEEDDDEEEEGSDSSSSSS